MKKIFTLILSLTASLTVVKGQVITFSYTGAMQTYTVPAGITSINVSCWGAQGGSGALGNSSAGATIGGPGGNGSKVAGTLAVTPGEVLNIFVGGQGATPTGGFNGGGNGGSANAGGGGGASDIRIGGTAEANRVIVAPGGGGGGRGGCESNASINGGAGGPGNTNGADGVDAPTSGGLAGAGHGGVIGTGGAAGIGCGGYLGAPGGTTATGTGANGGNGQSCCCFSFGSIPGGGGGGGGFVGGGGGGGGSAGTTGCSGNDKGAGGGGAGGSSYIGGVSSAVVTDGIWTGDGQITILVPVMASSTMGAAIACNGGTTTVTVSAMYGDSVYSGTGTFTVGAGTHFFTVTDGTGDTATTTIVVTEPSAIVTSSTQSNVSCNGLTDGTVNLTGSGGTPSYTFLWSNGATTEDLSGLAAGTYTVVLTDVNGCTVGDSITITEPAVLAATTTTTSNPTTCLGTNGMIDITVTGGTTGYTYLWSNGVTSEDQTALAAGTYSVTVTDANACSASVTSVTLTDPALPSVTISGTSTICNGTSTTLTGAGAVSYVWTGGPSTATNTISPTTSTTYTVTGTDANSCSNTATQLVTVNSVNIATTTSGVTITASATASSYQWINCPSGSLLAGATTQSYTATANGSYAVIVTTGSCSDTSSCVTINTIGINEYSQNNTLEVYPNPNTGSFMIQSTVEGTYSIVNELGQAINTVSLNAENNFKINIENLEAGIYLITGTSKNSVVNKRIVVTK